MSTLDEGDLLQMRTAYMVSYILSYYSTDVFMFLIVPARSVFQNV